MVFRWEILYKSNDNFFSNKNQKQNRRNSSRNDSNSSQGFQKDSDDSSRFMAMKEIPPPPKALHLSSVISGRKFKALVDTGAFHNFISEINAQGLEGENEETDPLVIEVANGESISSNRMLRTQIRFAGDRNIEYEINLRIIPKTSEELIIGMEFLYIHEGNIEVRNRIIS